MDACRISVAMCTYNGEKYIEEQITSILNQNCPVDEIVIGDDGSVDTTLEIAERTLSQSSVDWKNIRNEKNLGYRKNFENVIRHTRGEIVFLCDQDDVWLPEKTEVMMSVMEEDPSCLLAFSDAFLTDGNLNIKDGSLWDAVCYNENKGRFDNWMDLFFSGYYVTGAACCFRRELFEMCAPFSEIWVHDGWLAIHAALYGSLKDVPEKLVYYRQHEKNQIGASANQSLTDKVSAKLRVLKAGVDEQILLHTGSRDRWMEFYRLRKNDMPDAVRKKAATAVRVHQKLSRLPEYSLLKSIKTVRYCKKKGYYTAFYKRGKGCMYGDMLFLSAYHKAK